MENSAEREILCAMSEVESQCRVDLRVAWVRTHKDLCDKQHADLFHMYCDVFAEPPYLERFHPNDVKDYFADIIHKEGLVFLSKHRRTGELVSFNASLPLTKKDGVVELVTPYLETVDNVAYFAEDAVALSYRRHGVSRSMKHLLFAANRAYGKKTVVLRTNADCTAQIAAVKDLGGRCIDGLRQDVESLRLDGTTRPDRRIFFIIDLER